MHNVENKILSIIISKMGKINKMLYMLDLLNTGNKYTVKELANKLEVTERMIRYYKNEFEKSGIFIDSFKDPNGGYFLIQNNSYYTHFNKYDIDLLNDVSNFLLDNDYKYIKKDLKDICVLKLNSDASGYKKKQMIDIRLFNINNYGGLIIDGEFNQNNMVLMDDNLMTGKTMQIALNCMCDCNINVTNINIVRYPGINRVSQMFLNGHGAVDYRLFFEYITGLCFQCPYSWRDENSNDIYKDSLGVFDLNKKKIIECLIKKHDYSTISEVHEFYKIKRREKDEDN